MSVSLCMIVRNESSNLDACLASAAGLADELVIVDTGSTDETRAIAVRHGASVHEFPWCDDFAAARNESTRHARGDWIFWLDADDRIPKASHARLRELFASLPDENIAYLMTVVCPGPDGGPMFQLAHARLFRNRPDVRWVYRVHEQIGIAVLNMGGALRPTDIGIVHVGYVQPGAMTSKLERNLRLLDLELAVHPFNGFLLQARASTLLGLDRSAEALVTLNLCEPFAEHEALARNVAALRGQAYITEGRLPEALDAVRDGLARCPRDTKLWFLEAELLAALGELGEAEACLRAQLAFDEDHGRLACADRTIAAFRARALLADILLQRGRPDLAEVESRDVIAVRASFGHAWLTLGEALLEQGRYEELDALCAQLGSSRDAEVGRTVLSALRSSRDGDPERATLAIDQSLGARPGDLMLRKAKTRILAARADRGKALKEAVENVLALDPLCSRTRSIERWLNRKTFGLQAVGHSAPPCSLGPQVL